jgi:putative endonuclease
LVRVGHQEDDISSLLQWHLYMVRCREGTLYTGIATDVARRFSEHQGNSNKAAKYLRGRGPLELVFEKIIGTNKRVALSVEYQMKNLPKSRKEAALLQADIIDEMVACAVQRCAKER